MYSPMPPGPARVVTSQPGWVFILGELVYFAEFNVGHFMACGCDWAVVTEASFFNGFDDVGYLGKADEWGGCHVASFQSRSSASK